MQTNRRKLNRITTAVVGAVADWFRAQYCLYRGFADKVSGGSDACDYEPDERWDGGDRYGRNEEPVWPKIARVCIAKQLAPPEWLRHTFFPISELSSVPQPSLFLFGSAVKAYPVGDDRVLQAAIHFQNMENFSLQAQWEGEILGHRQRASRLYKIRFPDYSPLYRYCLLAREKAALSEYEVQALADYLVNRDAYRQVWTPGFIPTSLKDLAEEVLGLVLKQLADN